MAYNYHKFSGDLYDLADFRGPAPGTKAPDFDLTTPDGSPVRLLDFDGDFLVLEMGSLTCPLYQGHRADMTALVRKYPNVSFAVLYVREAHPGTKLQTHTSAEDKHRNARMLAEKDGEGRRILVDDFEGHAHRAYGAFPNSVFIINRNGCVVWASDWNNPQAAAEALAALTAGRPATNQAVFKPVPPSVSFRILRRAGGHALRDFLVGLPGLIWQNLVRRNVRVRSETPQAVAPDANC